MRIGFYNFAFAAVAASIAVGANADDAAGVMRASASNESVTVVMPFSPFPPGTPAYFLAGPFMGDGGAFSDMLHVAPADGSTPTNAVSICLAHARRCQLLWEETRLLSLTLVCLSIQKQMIG